MCRTTSKLIAAKDLNFWCRCGKGCLHGVVWSGCKLPCLRPAGEPGDWQAAASRSDLILLDVIQSGNVGHFCGELWTWSIQCCAADDEKIQTGLAKSWTSSKGFLSPAVGWKGRLRRARPALQGQMRLLLCPCHASPPARDPDISGLARMQELPWTWC